MLLVHLLTWSGGFSFFGLLKSTSLIEGKKFEESQPNILRAEWGLDSALPGFCFYNHLTRFSPFPTNPIRLVDLSLKSIYARGRIAQTWRLSSQMKVLEQLLFNNLRLGLFWYELLVSVTALYGCITNRLNILGDLPLVDTWPGDLSSVNLFLLSDFCVPYN